MPLELRYGLRKDTNKLVFVDDVLNGLQCGCICPHCKKALVAKNAGQKNEHHFAHYNGADCVGARMTALHLMAQNILQTTKQVMLPAYNKEFVQRKARSIAFDNVTLEDFITEQEIIRKPDCIGRITKGGQEYTLWIEILVTHEVDEEKSKDVKSLRQHCIEIDLSDMLNTDYDEQSVKECLITRADNRHWIAYPELDEQDNRLRLQALEEKRARRLQEVQERQEKERKIQAEKERCEQLAKAWRTNTTEKLTELVIQSISAHPYKQDEISVYDFLFSNCNWVNFIDTIPKNEYGLRVFYALSNYYWKDIYFDYPVYRRTINKLWFKKGNLTTEESIELEYYISIYMLKRLAQTYGGAVPETYKALKRTFTKSADFRKQVFMVLSFRYYHPFGCGINSFDALADQIINSYPALISLSLQLLEYIQQHYPQSLPLINGDNLIDRFREIDCNDISTPEYVENILQICFPKIFHRQLNVPQELPTPQPNTTQTNSTLTREIDEREWQRLKEWYTTHSDN
mgnify:CR=1 FL=1